MDKIDGHIYILGDDINTDDIVPSHALTMRDSHQMAQHALEHVEPDFIKQIHEKNIILAGENFGTGSSREEAVNVFKILGIKAIIAKSIARIYFRNLINKGIPAITLNWDKGQFSEGDHLEISLKDGIISNKTKKSDVNFIKLPEFLTAILEEGGLIKMLKKKIVKS